MSLTLENVNVVYGENTPFRKTALKDISIAFPPGKVTYGQRQKHAGHAAQRSAAADVGKSAA